MKKKFKITLLLQVEIQKPHYERLDVDFGVTQLIKDFVNTFIDDKQALEIYCKWYFLEKYIISHQCDKKLLKEFDYPKKSERKLFMRVAKKCENDVRGFISELFYSNGKEHSQKLENENHLETIRSFLKDIMIIKVQFDTVDG